MTLLRQAGASEVTLVGGSAQASHAGPGTDHGVALPHDAGVEAAVLDFVKTATSG